MLAAQGIIVDDGPRRAARRPRRRRGRAARRARSRSRPTTRTSTWPSSGGSPSSPGRSAGGCTPRARATTRWPPTSRSSRARRRWRAPARSTALMAALVDAAERHLDWPLPGYTHLQRAQPVYLEPSPAGLRVDARARPRAAALRRRADGGAAARRRRAGGRQLRHRPRRGRAPSSASSGVAPNSIDAVSNRDFVLDYLGAAATCATHLSRLGAELVLWSIAGVRLRRAARRVDERLVDHAPEEEPRRRRAAAGQGAADRRRTSPRCTA